MKILIVGVCLLTFMSWTPKEAEVRTEPTDQTKIRTKASNHNYEEEFVIKRAAEVKREKVTKTQEPIAKKVKTKAKVVKKETTKSASQKETKPKAKVTKKETTKPKAKVAKKETEPKAKVVKKETTKPKTKAVKKETAKSKPKVVKRETTKPKISKTPTPPKTETKPKVSVTAKTPAPPKTESPPKKAKEISFKLSFYTALPEHNGGYTKTASGENIVGLKNVVASNYYPLGTKIYLEGFGTVRVADRGGPDFNSSVRLDVLIQRKSGESDKAYAARVWDMGRQTIEGYIVE